MHLTRVAVLALTAAVAAPFAQTRMGEIEAWRNEKALRSRPEATSSLESKLVLPKARKLLIVRHTASTKSPLKERECETLLGRDFNGASISRIVLSM